MPFEETWGAWVRQFFHELFGSRLTDHLETELVKLRNDYEGRLNDKNVQIEALREEKAALTAKIALYEMTIMPHTSRVGAEIVAYKKPTKPNFAAVNLPAPKTRWEVVQEEHAAKIEKELEEERAAAKG
jgi:hypothetical protein